MPRLNSDALTWTTLLSKWVEFAQASLALPRDAEGDRWRQSVPAIINLQAVTFALNELDRLPARHRAYARDKAEVLIDENAAELERIWADGDLPEMVLGVLDDAADAFVIAAWCDLRELIWRGENPLVIPEFEIPELLDQLGQDGCGMLAIAQPGTFIMPGEPLAWWCDFDPPQRAANVMEERFPGSEIAAAKLPRQVFRQFEDDGRITGDVIAWADSEDVDGLPLLLPFFVDGKRIGSFTLDAKQWEEAQRSQIGERGVGVIDLTEDEEKL